MHLLITGASGHIGSTVAYNFNKKKTKTILITRGKTKLKILKKNFKNCEVKYFKDLKKKNLKIDTILHTASINDKETNNKKDSLKISLDITKKIFSNLNLSKINKVIYLSTAQVYGSNLFSIVNEKTKLIPNNDYGLSRYETEIYLTKLAKKFKFKLAILRISNVVGDPFIKNKKCLRLLPNDIKNQAIKFGTITLKSSGLQFRNFISLKRTSDIIGKFIRSNLLKKIEVFNIGGVNTTVLSLVKNFIKIYNIKKKKKLRLVVNSQLPSKVKKLQYKDNKMRRFLKIKKSETIKNIIKNFL